MIILIAGTTHTGKTKLAQTLLERFHYPMLSLDHLKMGLIRRGVSHFTPEDAQLLDRVLLLNHDTKLHYNPQTRHHSSRR